MKKIIVLLGLCILSISLFVYFLKPDQNPQTLQQSSKSANKHHNQISDDPNQQNAQAEQNQSSENPAFGKAKKLSEEATRYYKVAYTYGWETIVRDFENGTIAKSKIPDHEKKKLCELALNGTTVEQTKRLFSANCKPLNGKATFGIINGQIKNAEGKVDQTEIINKLKFFQAEGFFQSEGMYKLGPYEEKFNLQSDAIGWGA